MSKRQTIELHGNVIVQCRGKRNGAPDEQEWKVLRRWAEQERLEISAFVACN